MMNMAPPVFTDLGKATRDIFEKGYILDIFKLTAKNQTCGYLAMKTGLTHKFEDGTFKADVEGSYPFPRYGLTFTKKWNTQNVIGLAAELANKIYPGVSIKAEGTFNPDSGVKHGIYTLSYKHENVSGRASISGGVEANMMFDSSVVVGHEGWLGGVRAEFDNTEGVLKNHYQAVGHSYGGIQAFLIAQNAQIYTANIYQRVNNRLEMGISFGADLGDGPRKFYNLGARYLLDDDTSVRVKVDNQSMVGLGLESTLQGCIKLIFSCLIDAKKLNEGGHKFGVGVEIM
ncbi:Voltage-dependent anion-selective channel [Orchesella cincta]|uniref:Voltage-dependent anion-selective channel n=1 Tax=Orchesella cincta TaxID=48709 RepID=A0A1D2NBG7_ORCCI|nr:Voltage-dependent anion-selective channel [Orchesella cincta]